MARLMELEPEELQISVRAYKVDTLPENQRDATAKLMFDIIDSSATEFTAATEIPASSEPVKELIQAAAEGKQCHVLQLNPNILFIQAYLGETLIGNSTLHRDAEPMGQGMLLADVFVLEPYRGKGVFRKLLAEASRQAAANHATYLKVKVAKTNEAAADIYQNYGFMPIRTEMILPLKGSDAE